jgi:ribosome-binding factor A
MARRSSHIRPERVAERLRVEIADILQNELKDPRLGLVTCTRVTVSGDLSIAKVYVSTLAEDEGKKTMMKVLQNATGFVRRSLGPRLGLRLTPEIRFVYDPSVEYGIELEQLLERNRPVSDDEPKKEEGRPRGKDTTS